MGSQRPGCSAGRQLDRVAGGMRRLNLSCRGFCIDSPSRAYPDSGEVLQVPVTKPLLVACMRAKESRPKSIHGLFPLCMPTSSVASVARPSISALPVYKDRLHPPAVTSRFSQSARRIFGTRSAPPTSFPEIVLTGGKPRREQRHVSSSAGCSAINTNGGFRGPKSKHHATKQLYTLTSTNTFETIASRRAMQLSRRECRTVWM
jgi:hypothetical protein